MHQPSVAVQPNPGVTPTPHRATSPIHSKKRPRCRRGLRDSEEGSSHAAAPWLWEARAPGPGRALPMLRPGASCLVQAASGARALSLPRSGALAPLSPTHSRPSSACGSCASAQLRETAAAHSLPFGTPAVDPPPPGSREQGAGQAPESWQLRAVPGGPRRPPRGGESVTVGSATSEV